MNTVTRGAFAFAALIVTARTGFAHESEQQADDSSRPALPSESQAPMSRATDLPQSAAGLNPIRHGQAGAPPQRTTVEDDVYREPRFWLYNDNYFTWQPSSPGRTTVKFQISVRYDLIFIDPGRHAWINLGYTQKSFWDLFAFDRSSPFIENDYKPELFLTYRHNPKDRVSEASVGIQHESNGLGRDMTVDQTADSRGWNNLFVNLRYGFDRKEPTTGLQVYLTLALRAWYAFDVAPNNIMHYIGPGTATINLDLRLPNHPNFGELALETIIHERAIEGSVFFPVEALTCGHFRFSVYAQYFYGYAERLITFDQKVHNYYIGIGFI